jgi:hypothetical protein
MSQVLEAAGELVSLKELNGHFVKELNLTADQAEKLEKITAPDDAVFSVEITIPIKNGRGSYFVRVPTFGKKVTASAVLTEPKNGTWTVLAKVADSQFSFRNVSANQEISIPCTPTWFITPIEVQLIWSQGGDTTAKVKVSGEFC